MSSETPSENPSFMYSMPLGVHHTAEGTFLHLQTAGNMDEASAKEALGEYYGTGPDKIYTTDEHPIGRLAVGFRKWQSSWDPHAEKTNPGLN